MPRCCLWFVFLVMSGLCPRTLVSAEQKAPPVANWPFDAKVARNHQYAWAKHLNRLPESTNRLGMRLRLIPPGQFMMGSPESDKDAEMREKPQHREVIANPFYLGKYEVTRGEFRKFVKATNHKTEPERAGGAFVFTGTPASFENKQEYNWLNAGFEQTDEHPVVNVSWNDAVAFCKWLSALEHETYRLPTVSEWEWSCRAGSTGRWSFGDKAEDLEKYDNVADLSLQGKFPAGFETVKWGDGSPFTAAVGTYRSNPFGLNDMHGNVSEWCRGSDQEPGANRGGGWYARPAKCRSAYCCESSLNIGANILGFRILREISVK